MNAVTRTTVPPALRDFLRDKDNAARLRALRILSPKRFLLAVAQDYTLIALAISAVLAVQGSLLVAAVYPAALVLIAARQHALLVLMHEGAHRTISHNRTLNDVLADLLCGAPLAVSTRSYRTAHLTHHQHLNTAADPDWCRKTNHAEERAQWLFPAAAPLWKLLGSLYGHSVSYLLKSLADNRDSAAAQTTAAPVSTEQPALTDKQLKHARLGLYLMLAAGFSLLFSITGFLLGLLLFWLAPMLLVLPLIMRIRSIAEHFALPHDHPLRESRTVRAGWIERLLLAPHHIGLHIDHHLLASVPFHNLPALHRLLMGSTYYRTHAHLNDGYFFRRRHSQPGQRYATLADDMYSQRSNKLDNPTLSATLA